LKGVIDQRIKAGMNKYPWEDWKKGGCSKPPKTWRSHIAAASSF
jgi:hypothetical protein